MTEGTIGCEAARTDLSRRNLLIGIALAGASGIAFTRQPAVANPVVPKKLFEAWVPRRFGRWDTVSQSGVVLPPHDALSDRLYDNPIGRSSCRERVCQYV